MLVFMPPRSARNITGGWYFADCETHFGHVFGIHMLRAVYTVHSWERIATDLFIQMRQF